MEKDMALEGILSSVMRGHRACTCVCHAQTSPSTLHATRAKLGLYLQGINSLEGSELWGARECTVHKIKESS